MEANKILTANILDIIFDGRNKDYGAFDLRKNYNSRLLAAMGSTFAITVLAFLAYITSSRSDTTSRQDMIKNDVTLVILPPAESLVLPPPPIQKPQPRTVAERSFVVPNIVPDEKVMDSEVPPVDELVKVIIGLKNRDGDESNDITALPDNAFGKGIVDPPKKEKNDLDSIFTRVEIESFYPGGPGAWLHYLNKSVRYPQEAQDIEIQGTIRVQFIVDREGNASEVKAMSGPVYGGLREEAERVIKKSGKWEPAIQNGRKVKSYKVQPITFRLG